MLCLLLTLIIPNRSVVWSTLRTSRIPTRSDAQSASPSLSPTSTNLVTEPQSNGQLETDLSIRKTPPDKVPYEQNSTTTSSGLPSLLDLFKEQNVTEAEVNPLWSTPRYGTNSKPSVSGDKRIVGGTLAAAGAYPTYAFTAGSQLCGSTLIWYDVLLTAAHCDTAFLDGILIGGLRIDGSDGRFVQVTGEYPHPEYSFETGRSDTLLGCSVTNFRRLRR